MKAAFLGASVNNIRISIIVMVVVTAVCTDIVVKYFKWELKYKYDERTTKIKYILEKKEIVG